jgi:hypothetical protein
MIQRLSRGRTVRTYFARRPLRRRIVALAAAYAIALSSLIASFGAASVAAAAAVAPSGIICHTLVAGDEAPASGDTNNKHCIDNCCIGCMMLMAAVPPPAKIVRAPLLASQSVAPPQNIVLVGALQTKDHRSRAPPLAA